MSMINKTILLILCTILLASLALWWATDSFGPHQQKRIAGMEEFFEHTSTLTGREIFPEELIIGSGQPAASTASWLQFRGNNRDAITSFNGALNLDFNSKKPPILWQKTLGEGHSGPVIANGRVYILDYDMEKQGDLLRCISLEDGQDIWQYFYPVRIKRNHGISRTIPAINEDYCLTIGPMGQLLCLDVNSGQKIWKKDLVADFGTRIPDWYAGQCPIIIGNTALIAPAGSDILIMAIDLPSGNIIWTIPNDMKWNMTHTSIMPMVYQNHQTFIYCASGGVIAFDIEGQTLWTFNDWQVRIANIPSPLVIGDNKILLTGSYNAGAKMIQLHGPIDNIAVSEVFALPPRSFGSKQQTPLYYQGHIYGIRQDGRLCGMDIDGNILWTSDDDFGFGPCFIINDIIYAMNDYGLLRLVRAQSSSYEKLTEFQVIDGRDSWAPFALADNILLLRDMDILMAIDISQ